MSAPSKPELLTLEWTWLGQPFVAVAASDADAAEYAWLGQPLVLAPSGVPPGPTATNGTLFCVSM